MESSVAHRHRQKDRNTDRRTDGQTNTQTHTYTHTHILHTYLLVLVQTYILFYEKETVTANCIEGRREMKSFFSERRHYTWNKKRNGDMRLEIDKKK